MLYECDDPEDEESYTDALREGSVLYARHMWNRHYDVARTDYLAVMFIRLIAAEQARTS
jgi:hypothetical protein